MRSSLTSPCLSEIYRNGCCVMYWLMTVFPFWLPLGSTLPSTRNPGLPKTGTHNHHRIPGEYAHLDGSHSTVNSRPCVTGGYLTIDKH